MSKKVLALPCHCWLFLTVLFLIDSKLDSKSQLHLLPELADLNNCNNTLYFEARRHEDLYLWATKTPNGPSIKMHVQNVHTMDELKMTGNCLKGSRGLLSFDKAFEDSEWGKLTKELFTHVSTVVQLRLRLPFITFELRYSAFPRQPAEPSHSLITFLRSPYLIQRYGSAISRYAFVFFLPNLCHNGIG